MIRSKQRVLALADLVAPLFCLVTRREANLALVSVRDPAGRLSKKGLNLHLIPCSMIVAFSGLAGSESRRESEPEGLNSTATQTWSVLLVCGIVSSVQQLEGMERDFFHIPPTFDGNCQTTFRIWTRTFTV